MTTVYKIDPNKKRKYFYNIGIKILLIDFCVIIGFIIYYDINAIDLIIKLALGVLLYSGLLFLGPLTFLFINHLKNSQEVNIIYDNIQKTYKLNLKNTKTIFDSSDVQQVVKFVSPPSFDNRVDWLMWGKYFYTEITLKNGSIFRISCLTLDNTEDVFPNFIKKKKVFPIITNSAKKDYAP